MVRQDCLSLCLERNQVYFGFDLRVGDKHALSDNLSKQGHSLALDHPPARPYFFHLILEKVTGWQLSTGTHDASCCEHGAAKVRSRAKRVPKKVRSSINK